MKTLNSKKIISIICAVLIFANAISIMPAISQQGVSEPVIVAEAATKIKLSAKTATIKVGKTKTLKLKGAKASKVKWSSSNKKIATVNSKGKVKAKKKGKVTITAKYKNKKYTCKVTVKKAKKKTAQAVPAAPIIKDISNSYFINTSMNWDGSQMTYNKSTGTWDMIIYAMKSQNLKTYYVKFECVDSTGTTIYTTIEESYYGGSNYSYFKVYDIPKETTMIYCSDFD